MGGPPAASSARHRRWPSRRRATPTARGRPSAASSTTRPRPAASRLARSTRYKQAQAAGFRRHVSCFRTGGPFEHPKGRACDYAAQRDGFGGTATGGDRRYGNDLAAFFVRNADRLGVLYVIWFRQIWFPGNGLALLQRRQQPVRRAHEPRAPVADLTRPLRTIAGDGRHPRGARALPQWLAASLVFLASGAVLVLEIVALRLIGPYVGVTLQTSSSVIGMALGAIAYGAWLGGWLADKRDPRRLLAPALVLAGIATALTLPLVRYAGEVLRGGAAGSILLLTALAVFVPAALLSAVTPLVVKLQLGDLRRTGQVVGKLSSIGTLGAITATLATGFVLVAALPSSAIMLSLAVGLGLAGIALGVYLRRATDRASLPGRGRTRAMVAVLGLAGAGLTTVAPNPCDVETAYHCASVVVDPERSTGRVLC